MTSAFGTHLPGDTSTANFLNVASNRPEASDSVRPDFRGKRVLVVDDNSDNRRIIVRFLSDLGAELVIAQDGQECLTAIEESRVGRTPIDMVILDMQMPVMDGYSAARRLRDKSCRIPIIAVTAHAMPEDRSKCLAAGCDDYVSKPINREGFYATLRKHISAPDAGSDAPIDNAALRSSLAGDPSFAPILADYVSRMPLVSQQIRAGLNARDAALIRAVAHKIRGTAANYGFPQITLAAGRCDDAIRSGEPWSSISQVAEELDHLVLSAIAGSK